MIKKFSGIWSLLVAKQWCVITEEGLYAVGLRGYDQEELKLNVLEIKGHALEINKVFFKNLHQSSRQEGK